MSASSDYLQTLTSLTDAKARAQAEAARSSGQIWGSTIANIGQIVSQYPEQQAKLKEIANRADLTRLERDRETRAAAAEQRTLQSQQQAAQFIKSAPRNPDGTYDVAGLSQQLLAGGDPKSAEQILTSLENINKFTQSYNQHQQDQGAEWADNALKDIKPDDPNPWDAVYFHAEAAPPGFISESDKTNLVNLSQQGVSPIKMLQEMKARGSQFKKSNEPYTLSKDQQRYEGGQLIAQNATTEPPKTDAEMLFDSLNPNSKTQAISQEAVQKKADLAKAAITNKPMTPYEQAELKNRDREFGLAQQRLAEAIRRDNKVAATAAASGLADTVVAHPELWNQLTPSAKEKLAATLADKGFTGFAAKESATLENRLASSKAVLQTSNDMIKLIKDNAKELGPLMGRYNSVADFVGNPPPKFKELAGLIESYSLANMGVHGMRAVNGADAIKQTIGEGHQTPESMIATINGLNGFASHLLENEGRGVPGGSSAVPSVGSTFQGGKVLKVTPVP